MQHRGIMAAVAALVVLLSGCGAEATPGEMSSQTYRSLDASGSDLTAQAAQDKGAIEDESLEQTFLAEGGSPTPEGATCLYAKTTYRTKYRGMARFCFDGEKLVSAERNRADLE